MQEGFTTQNNTICFLPGDRSPLKSAGEGLLAKAQDILKKNGRLYYLIIKIFAPVLSTTACRKKLKSLLNRYGENHIIINLGSGPHYIHNRKDVINIDIFAFDEVDIAADASTLPILDDSIDLIINGAMLEHVSNPKKVVEEMERILKPGGEIFCFLPFIAPFHAAPADFYRWTMSGAKELFVIFKDIETGIGTGPTSGMLWTLQEWIAILFSFGSKKLHDFIFIMLMILTAPVKLLDIVLARLPYAEKIAGGFYIISKK